MKLARVLDLVGQERALLLHERLRDSLAGQEARLGGHDVHGQTVAELLDAGHLLGRSRLRRELQGNECAGPTETRSRYVVQVAADGALLELELHGAIGHDVLAHDTDQLGHLLGHSSAVHLHSGQLVRGQLGHHLRGWSFGQRTGHAAHERLELVVHGHKVRLAVDFHHGRTQTAVGHFGGHETLGRLTSSLLAGRRDALLAQPLESGREVALGSCQRIADVLERRLRLSAQLLHGLNVRLVGAETARQTQRGSARATGKRREDHGGRVESDFSISDRYWNTLVLPSLVDLSAEAPVTKTAAGLELGNVIKGMRRQNAYVEQSACDAAVLKRLGFVWDHFWTNWNDCIVPTLETFKEVNGHGSIPA
ncbi:hypothetical protein P3T76_001907 [Phytophthora citrophthora]|uniref:Uncharacterized protein n=1 Tax=Phytophthora citrophthora TaxID=4793 RepID=A0AAD9GXE0_9STRA|nr:hypothetical protein P3T76_001907 [Phytophthora citrophthora]